MNEYERARYISENSLHFINRRAWALVGAARNYLAAESFRRRHRFGITAESYRAWRAFSSELDGYCSGLSQRNC
jgi:hypothetical protein